MMIHDLFMWRRLHTRPHQQIRQCGVWLLVNRHTLYSPPVFIGCGHVARVEPP